MDTETFPELSNSEMACLAEFAEKRDYVDGETLRRSGDRGFSFFAVISGQVAITEESSGIAREIAIHGPAHYTGDIDLLTQRPSLVTAVARRKTTATK